MKKNVFIVGLDAFNLEKLKRLPKGNECNFYPALDISDIRGVEEFNIPELIDKAVKNIEKVGKTVDGIAAYFDFPATDLVPILAEKFNVPGPSLESILKCENKYWSRLEQQKVIPGNIPQFQAFDPFEDDVYEKIALLAPFWIKPIKSFRSYLAFKINDERQFQEAMTQMRENIGYLEAPFNHLMKYYGMPDEISTMNASAIAESPITGSQCTIEGYVFNGRVVVYGVVDSVREGDRSSFARYEYPSLLPLEVQHRMIDVGRDAIKQIGLDNSAFNIEFFYNQTFDEVFLLEINPRISQAHTDIFEKVHGYSHLQIMLDLALGRKPLNMERKGKFSRAGNFMLRTYEAGTVKLTPSEKQLKTVADTFPETIIKPRVKPGQKLKELTGQDSYSYELANIFIGGRDQSDIIEKYDKVLELVTFEIEKDPDAQLF